MSETPTDQEPETGPYEIRLKGHLGPRWVARFDGMTVTRENDGTTLLSGEVTDQAALHGLLNSVRNLGLVLLSVRQPAAEARQPISDQPPT